MKQPLALTMGDPAGIGGEIALRAWQELRTGNQPFLVVDDPTRLSMLASRLGMKLAVQAVSQPEDAAAVFPDALPVFSVPVPVRVEPGRPDPDTADAVVTSIRRAVQMAQMRRVAGVITNPISKAVLYAAGFRHPGHTELLGEITGVTNPVMMLASPLLRVVPVTVHVALRHALDMLTTDMIVAAARVTAEALRRDFGIDQPRLAIAGLNPHAGENGSMGLEEGAVIIPAVAALRQEGLQVEGPFPPDTMFTDRARATYDVAICMYHDQALIPLKTLDIDRGVNVTLGLPIVRTSPDHGTAFDIAGKGQADPSSLIAAIQLAAQMAARRAA